jgi:Holliday junction resolvase RusA-like endonuclease
MPASRPVAMRRAGQGPKTTAPDLDKLVRSVGDALTEGGLIRDDARICAVHATKSEVQGWSGAVITIEEAHG